MRVQREASVERRLPSEQRIVRRSKRVQVAARIALPAGCLFWAQVARRLQGGVALRPCRIVLLPSYEPEVDELDQP